MTFQRHGKGQLDQRRHDFILWRCVWQSFASETVTIFNSRDNYLQKTSVHFRHCDTITSYIFFLRSIWRIIPSWSIQWLYGIFVVVIIKSYNTIRVLKKPDYAASRAVIWRCRIMRHWMFMEFLSRSIELVTQWGWREFKLFMMLTFKGNKECFCCMFLLLFNNS